MNFPLGLLTLYKFAKSTIDFDFSVSMATVGHRKNEGYRLHNRGKMQKIHSLLVLKCNITNTFSIYYVKLRIFVCLYTSL